MAPAISRLRPSHGKLSVSAKARGSQVGAEILDSKCGYVSLKIVKGWVGWFWVNFMKLVKSGGGEEKILDVMDIFDVDRRKAMVGIASTL
eukprot:1356657-Amorphochlora_amoeboformis.AAC.3